MLVLSRKVDERIRIGDNITIVVVEIREGKVRLGVEAPDEVSIHRQEVYDAIQRDGERRKKAIDPSSPEGRALAAKEMKELRESDEKKKEEEEGL